MNNFIQRALTGTVFVAVIVGCVIWNEWSFLALLGVINVLCIWEYIGITVKEKTRLHQVAASGIATGLLATVAHNSYHARYDYWYFIPLLLLFVVMAGKLFAREEKPFEGFAHILVSLMYITVPMVLLYDMAIIQIEKTEYIYIMPLLVFALIWTNDTFAYLTGRLFGRHKLFERISPGKTWEGFIGGLVFTLAAILIFYNYGFPVMHHAPIIKWLLFAAIISVFGTLGDLVESLFKRSYGIKDSGNILPGHGGVLDRFDALLFLIPFAYVFFKMIIL